MPKAPGGLSSVVGAGQRGDVLEVARRAVGERELAQCRRDASGGQEGGVAAVDHVADQLVDVVAVLEPGAGPPAPAGGRVLVINDAADDEVGAAQQLPGLGLGCHNAVGGRRFRGRLRGSGAVASAG